MPSLSLQDCTTSMTTVAAGVGTILPAGTKTITITKDAPAVSNAYTQANIAPSDFIVPNATVVAPNVYDTTAAGNVDDYITQIELVQGANSTQVDVIISHTAFVVTLNMERRIDIDWRHAPPPPPPAEISRNYCCAVAYPNDPQKFTTNFINHNTLPLSPVAASTLGSVVNFGGNLNSGNQTGFSPNGQPFIKCITVQVQMEPGYYVEDPSTPAGCSITYANMQSLGYDYLTPNAWQATVVNANQVAPSQYDYFEIEIVYEAQEDSNVPTNLDPDPFGPWDTNISPYPVASNQSGTNTMCDLNHRIDLRFIAKFDVNLILNNNISGAKYPDGSTVVLTPPVPIITGLIDRTNRLPNTQNPPSLWIDDTDMVANAPNVPGAERDQGKIILDDDGFITLERNIAHSRGRRIPQVGGTRIYNVLGTPGAKYKFHVKADRNDAGEYGDDYYHFYADEISKRGWSWEKLPCDTVFTIPESGVYTHEVVYYRYTSTMSTTYKDRNIEITLEPVEGSKLANGIPSKELPYEIIQGIDTTKVYFGITCTGFTSPSNVSVEGPSFFRPTRVATEWEGTKKSPYYVSFSGTINRSASKTISAISSDLSNYSLTNSAIEDNKGTKVTVENLSVTTSDNANLTVSADFYVNQFGDPTIENTPIILDLDNIVTTS